MKQILDLDSDIHCRVCDGTGIYTSRKFVDLERDVANILDSFPTPDIMGKGQWFFSPMTISRTIAYMFHKGDIEGKKIVCLSTPTLAIGLAIFKLKTDIDFSLSVLDIDLDILNFIKTNFNFVNILEYDYSKECPEHLKGQFDCFIFDPLYSEDHYKIGLSRCIQLIGNQHPDKIGYIVIPPEEIAPVKIKDQNQVPLQLIVFEMLIKMGFCIADFKEKFVDYETPPAEIGILQKGANPSSEKSKIGEWRSSDLIRTSSTKITIPLINGDVDLIKKVNNKRRTGRNFEFIQLDEISIASKTCSMCVNCFSAHIEDQKKHHYIRYWSPEIQYRQMPSWRDEFDQPFEVAPSCVGFEDIKKGVIVLLRGPAAKKIWETIRDLEENLGDTIDLDDFLSGNLDDYNTQNHDKIKSECKKYLNELMGMGLLKKRIYKEDMN